MPQTGPHLASATVAVAGWGELLPLLVFIILGWLANRAKQKKEAEDLAGKPGQPKPPGLPAPQGERARRQPGRQEPHTVDDGEDVEDWTGEEWEGEPGERWDDRRSGEVRTEKPRPAEDRVERLRPVTPPPDSRHAEFQRDVPKDREDVKPSILPPKAKEKAAEVGKDLLSQLAKELGLELPKPQPRPAPKPAPAPQAKPSRQAPKPPAHAHHPKSHHTSPDEVRARAAEANRSQARPVSTAPVAAPIAKPLISLSEITDVEAVRKAFVLKTILDKPLALKPRGLKPD